MINKILLWTFYPLNLVSLLLILIYQNTFSLLVGNCCRFYPSCSQYAFLAYKKFNFFLASFKVSLRLLKCQPFYNGDPIDNIK